MMKNGAPPDKVGVLNRSHGFTKLISKGYQTLVPGLISILYRRYGSFEIWFGKQNYMLLTINPGLIVYTKNLHFSR